MSPEGKKTDKASYGEEKTAGFVKKKIVHRIKGPNPEKRKEPPRKKPTAGQEKSFIWGDHPDKKGSLDSRGKGKKIAMKGVSNPIGRSNRCAVKASSEKEGTATAGRRERFLKKKEKKRRCQGLREDRSVKKKKKNQKALEQNANAKKPHLPFEKTS